MKIVFERALITIGAIFYLFVFPHGVYGDAYARMVWLEKFLQTGQSLDIKYPMLGPLCSTPLVWLSHLYKNSYWWLSRYNAILFLLTLWLLSRALRAYLDAGARRRLVVVLLATSMFPKHVTDYYGEVFSACLTCLGFIWLHQNRQKIAFVSIIMATINMPATVVATICSTAALVWNKKNFRYSILVVGSVMGIVIENYIRHHTFFSGGYGNDAGSVNASPYSGLPGFSYPIFFGLLSVLFSFGKGICFFAPGIFAWKYFTRAGDYFRQLSTSYLCYSVGLLLIYAPWWSWSGGWFWGPRFFLFISIPASFGLFFLLEKTGRTLGESMFAMLLLVWSTWVAVSGVSFGQNNLEACSANGGYLELLCWYVPEYSVLWRPFIAERYLRGSHIAYLFYFSLAAFYLAYPVLRVILLECKTRLHTLVKANSDWDLWKW